MAHAKKPWIQERPGLSIHTFSLAPDEAATLRQLSGDASDFLGQSISNSAIVRALLRQIGQQGSAAAEALFLEVERELNAGVKWSRTK
jgi:hypothetical protein